MILENEVELQLVEQGHATALYQIWADDAVTEYMNIESFSSISQAEQMITFFQKMVKEKQAARYAILANDEVIGSCGFNFIDIENKRTEIGYELGTVYWKKGYGRQAIRKLILIALDDLEMVRIEAKVRLENAPSVNLLKSLGFEVEGILRKYEMNQDKLEDMYLLSFIKDESTLK